MVSWLGIWKYWYPGEKECERLSNENISGKVYHDNGKPQLHEP